MQIFRRAYDWLGDTFGFSNGQFVRLYLNPTTYSGRNITPKTSLQTISVLRCATLIAGAGASLPVDVYARRGGRVVHEDTHAVEFVLDSQPNPWMSPMDFRAMMWLSFLLWGNAYALKVMDGGRLVALWPLQADCMEIKATEGGDLLYLYTPPGKGKAVPYEQKDILHIRWYSLDGVNGLSAIEQARQAISRQQDAEEYGARFFRNGARPSVVMEYPNKLGPQAIENLRKSFEEVYGGVENAHKIAVLEQGATLKTLSVSARDAQFLEQEQYSDERIAMLFGIPPHMVGLVSKTTSWGTGISEQTLGFMKYTLEPLLVFWEKALERCLLNNTRESRFFIKHNINAFLRADIKARFDAYAVAVDKGIMCRDEPRKLEDLDPIPDGSGQMFTVQAQMIPLNMAGKVTQPSAPGGSNAQ